MDPAVQIRGSIGFEAKVPNGRFQLTPMAWGAPQDRMRERSELGASSGHLDPETDGFMDLDCWIHGSMDLHW